MDLFTKLIAPIAHPSPIVTFGKITLPTPIIACFEILTGP